MGIGRREFLKMASIAFGGGVILAKTGVAMNGDYYVHSQLGLGFAKPREWKFEALRDFSTQAKGQVLSGLSADESDEIQKDHASTLVAIITKYGKEVSGFGPSITIFKNEEDKREIQDQSLEAITSDAISGFRTMLRNYEVSEAPSTCEFSKCRAMRFKTRWVFEHRDIRPMLIDDETILIDQGPTLYTIHLYDSPYTGETAPSEFLRFKESLYLA